GGEYKIAYGRVMTSSFTVSTKRKEAFTEELGSVLTRRTVVTVHEERTIIGGDGGGGGVDIEEVSTFHL
ncbi:hypothetical protein L9F63_003565, partial [Diploptera punctata]